MQSQARRIIAEQQKEMLAKRKETETAKISTEKTRATANQQGELVTAEIGVQTPDILVAGEKGGMLDILLAQLVKKNAAPPKKLPVCHRRGKRANSSEDHGCQTDD